MAGAVAVAGPLDLNAATVEERAELPGMGPMKARALAEWRAEHGRCEQLDQVLQAPGIGEATVRGWNGEAVCGPGQPEPLEPAVHPLPPARSSFVVDLNHASVEELQLLPGVTEARARDIVDDRQRLGDYGTCRDATRIDGIGPATVAAWGERCAP